MTDAPYLAPYQDISHLTRNLCISERTVDAWVKRGILPPPKVKDGKRLWKWKEVERYLDGDPSLVPNSPTSLAERIRDATKMAASEGG